MKTSFAIAAALAVVGLAGTTTTTAAQRVDGHLRRQLEEQPEGAVEGDAGQGAQENWYGGGYRGYPGYYGGYRGYGGGYPGYYGGHRWYGGHRGHYGGYRGW